MEETLEKEVKSICTLLETWEETNMTIAQQILSGSPPLAAAVETYYRSLFNTTAIKLKNVDWWQNLLLQIGRGSMVSPDKTPESIAFFNKLPIYRFEVINAKRKTLPWWLSEISSLTHINIKDNAIEALPEDIGRLSRLQELYADNNCLSSLPDSLCDCSELQRLHLDFNQIGYLPQEIGQLKKLTHLCLEGNKIKHLPRSAVELDSLRWLSIEKTPLGKKYKVKRGMFTKAGNPSFRKFLEPEEGSS